MLVFKGSRAHMATSDNLNRGRDAFLCRAWTDAYDLLTAADGDEPLQPDDVERLATAAYLIGRDKDSAELWTRAHNVLLNRGAVDRAARCAFWLALTAPLKLDSRGGSP
jgi:hypothetical protein